MAINTNNIWKWSIIIVIICIVSYTNIRQGERRFQENQCKAWIETIEHYCYLHDSLPIGLDEVELVQTTRKPIYYLKRDSSSYYLYFELDRDNWRIYHSELGQWRSEPKRVLEVWQMDNSLSE